MYSVKEFSYPTYGQEFAVETVSFQIYNKLLNYFPKDMFKFKGVFNPGSQRNLYENKKKTNLIKTKHPKFVMNTRIDTLKEDDSIRPGLVSTRSEYYGNFGQFALFFNDKQTEMRFDNKRIKVNVVLTFTTKTENDKMTLYNMIRNTIKLNNAYYFENIISRHQLPNDMINTLFSVMSDKNRKQTTFNEYLSKHSSNLISPYYVYGHTNKLLYYLNYPQKGVYTIFEEMTDEEGEKEGVLFNKFRISISGYYYIWVPSEYMIYIKEMVYRMKVPEFYYEEYDEKKLVDRILKELDKSNLTNDEIEEKVNTLSKKQLIKELNDMGQSINPDDYKLESPIYVKNPYFKIKEFNASSYKETLIKEMILSGKTISEIDHQLENKSLDIIGEELGISKENFKIDTEENKNTPNYSRNNLMFNGEVRNNKRIFYRDIPYDEYNETKIMEETDLYFSVSNESFSLKEFIETSKTYKSGENIDLENLLTAMKLEKFSILYKKNIIKIRIYESKYYLDKDIYMNIDDDYIISLNSVDINENHTLTIISNLVNLKTFLYMNNKYKEYVEKEKSLIKSEVYNKYTIELQKKDEY